MDANEAIICLTREDFADEEEFLKWKAWSDENYHTAALSNKGAKTR